MCSSAIRRTTERPSLPKMRHFRYELLNRSEAARACIANQRVLRVIEPLLGEDCHIIANTAWNNQPAPGSEGQAWHVDGGPHIPLPKGALAD